MSSQQVAFLIALTCMTGCIVTHQVDFMRADDWITTAHDQLMGKNVTVRTADSQEYNGRLTNFTLDSVKVWDGENEVSIELELEEVSYIGRRPNAAGPLLAGVVGSLIGGLVGASIGSAEDPEGGSLQSSFDGISSGATTGALVGGVVGLTIGGVASKVDQYEIHHSLGSSAMPGKEAKSP